jgi:hypothetical protein
VISNHISKVQNYKMQRTILKLIARNEKGLFPAGIETSAVPVSFPGEAPIRLARQLLFLSLWFFLLVSLPPAILAQDVVKTYRTQYTIISFKDEMDLHTFTGNIGTGLNFLLEGQGKKPEPVKNRVDKIVERVCSILDIHPLNLRFGITLYKAETEFAAAFRATGISGSAPVAFYSHKTRSIAVLPGKVTDRIIAHEIAHAVLCIYFVAPPPARMQEILAQYVDKHLWD